jgi:hypothetical protein
MLIMRSEYLGSRLEWTMGNLGNKFWSKEVEKKAFTNSVSLALASGKKATAFWLWYQGQSQKSPSIPW